MSKLSPEALSDYVAQTRALEYPSLTLKFIRHGDQLNVAELSDDITHADIWDNSGIEERPDDAGSIIFDLLTQPRAVVTGKSSTLEIGSDKTERAITLDFLRQLAQSLTTDEFALNIS